MKDREPVKTAARRRRRDTRLGDGPRTCILCGHADLENLTHVTADWLTGHGTPRALLEEHHLVGKHHDAALTVPLCRNCHGNATERLAAAGVTMRAEPDSRWRVAIILEALAVFFEMLVIALRRWAHLLRSETPSAVPHA